MYRPQGTGRAAIRTRLTAQPAPILTCLRYAKLAIRIQLEHTPVTLTFGEVGRRIALGAGYAEREARGAIGQAEIVLGVVGA